MAPAIELRWKRDNGSWIFGGEPEGYTGKETGILLRLKLIKHLNLGKMVLDVGCAVGASLQPLKKHGFITVGLDPERRFLLEGKVRDNAYDFVQAIGENIPLQDAAFDLVLLFETLEHVIKPEKTLKEINRVLKPNGILFSTVPNRFYPFETHGLQVYEKQIENLLGIGIPLFSLMPNFLRKKFERARIYSQSELARLLKKHGFEPFVIDYMMPPLDKTRQTPLTIAVRKIFLCLSKVPIIKKFGVSVMIVSQRTIFHHSPKREPACSSPFSGFLHQSFSGLSNARALYAINLLFPS